MKRIFASAIVRVSVSLLLIVILVYIMRGKYGQILEVLKNTNAAVFGLALAVFLLAQMLASLRLKLIIEAQDISVTFYDAVSLTFIGYFFNNFLPTSIGGDVVKAYYLSRKHSDKTGSYTSVFVDRAIGLVTMIFMAFIVLIFVGNSMVDKRIKYMISAITAVSVLGIVFLAHRGFARKFSALFFLIRPLEDKLRKIYGAVNKYRHHTSLLVKTFAISIASQLCYFACVGILVSSIGSCISGLDILLRMPIVSMMSLLPSINGLGLREGATVVLFEPLIGRANAFAISILTIVLLLISSVVGGLIYALSPQFKIKLKVLKEVEEGGPAV